MANFNKSIKTLGLITICFLIHGCFLNKSTQSELSDSYGNQKIAERLSSVSKAETQREDIPDSMKKVTTLEDLFNELDLNENVVGIQSKEDDLWISELVSYDNQQAIIIEERLTGTDFNQQDIIASRYEQDNLYIVQLWKTQESSQSRVTGESIPSPAYQEICKNKLKLALFELSPEKDLSQIKIQYSDGYWDYTIGEKLFKIKIKNINFNKEEKIVSYILELTSKTNSKQKRIITYVYPSCITFGEIKTMCSDLEAEASMSSKND